MNRLSVKAKFRIGQFKSLKFCKFGGQFDLEGQDQGHKFLKCTRPLDDQHIAPI